YSSASSRFDAAGALGALGGAALGLKALKDRLRTGEPRLNLASPGEQGHRSRPIAANPLRGLALVGALGTAAVALLVLAKRRRAHRLLAPRDARRLARGCRQELVAFLADQRILVPETATSGDLGSLLEGRLGIEAAAFTRSLDRARFSRDQEAEREATRCRAELRTLLARVRKRLTTGQRARGFFSLRSLRVS
ncbi:MAG: hypothetical protein LC713_05155, partial [Actinobacteria bacterium]|nr:hypothetical protein [Actinomycetota bacterium]